MGRRVQFWTIACFMFWILYGCKASHMSSEGIESDISATGRGSCGDNYTIDSFNFGRCWNDADRLTIYRNLKSIALPIFFTMFQRHENGLIGRADARQVAIHSKTMLKNLMASGKHPLAFFAMIKDFETSKRTSWSRNGGNVYTTRNCTSKECYGLFQIDVKSEPRWNPQICQDLGIHTMLGGMDFCAAVFWWILAEGGRKCAKVNPTGSNPCKTPGAQWTFGMMDYARTKAYVQAKQAGWDHNAWSEMYGNYYRIAIQDDGKQMLGIPPQAGETWRNQVKDTVFDQLATNLNLTHGEATVQNSSEGTPTNEASTVTPSTQSQSSRNLCDYSALHNCAHWGGGAACIAKHCGKGDRSCNKEDLQVKLFGVEEVGVGQRYVEQFCH